MMKTTLYPWMKRMNSITPRRNLFLSLIAFAAFALLLAGPLTATAQKNVPRERIAEGKVVNKDGATHRWCRRLSQELPLQ